MRLGHGRAGTRVRGEEADVIAKLDKMIEQLEEQAQSMGLGAAGGGSNAPAAPMEDSMPAGGTGPGNVGPKQFGSRTDWGNLPPKEREEALQQISKDLPSHYRDVIEEYFRKPRKQKSGPEFMAWLILGMAALTTAVDVELSLADGSRRNGQLQQLSANGIVVIDQGVEHKYSLEQLQQVRFAASAAARTSGTQATLTDGTQLMLRAISAQKWRVHVALAGQQ